MDWNQLLANLAQLNLAKQKRIEQHGGNWRANQASQGSATQQPDSCAGGAGSQSAGQGTQDPNQYTFQGASLGDFYGASLDDLYSYTSSGTWNFPIALPSNYFTQDLITVSEAAMERRRANGKWAPPWMGGDLSIPNDARTWKPRKVNGIKSDGLIAGEIMAWRAWHWNGKRLRSIFVDYEWPTHKPALGEPGNGYGLHAFKEFHRTLSEYEQCLEDILCGQVALWGDVIEFNQGYTAEFGKVVSLIKPVPRHHRVTDEKLAEIRALYQVKE